MALLVIRRPGTEDRVFRIRGERVTIGRDDSAGLVLPNVSVSRLHACLNTRGERCELVDLNSTNGVKVNGERTERKLLEHRDVLKIGKYRLEYYDERMVDLLQVTRLAALGSRNTASKHSNMSTLYMQPEEIEAQSTAEQACEHAVVVRMDPEARRWRPGGGRITIGPGGDIPVELMFTSQPVAEIRWDGTQHLLRTSSWAHRVEVNGERILEAVLEPGATFRVGDATFEFIHEPQAT